ncbi:hypothetical protein NMY22_g1864 [Coprinellus aureogranulatus]|nr:hypothetical protein NMY22_g1864 [Coprinellus aureogranulatus]
MPMKEILLEEEEDEQELRVTFYPELYLQRRIWILDILRRENMTQVWGSLSRILDVGCGEGELLTPLCQPAPWLAPPPPDRLPPPSTDTSSDPSKTASSPDFNNLDGIPELHPSIIHGLDASADDLAFAIDRTRPSGTEEEFDPANPPPKTYTINLTRFEPLDVKLWEGGLEVINEEFVGIECIVSTEVIEHLSPSIYPFFDPVLLGVYHPKFLLVTTPSYTFNARFTSPNAPTSVRQGFRDPTGRTDRVFRHSDHKFEWTTEEFEEWVNQAAKEWGYEPKWGSIGRAREKDPYGREEELGGASFVVEFKKLEPGAPGGMTDAERERKGRDTVEKLASGVAESERPPHKLAAHHQYPTHPTAKNPLPLPKIAEIVKNKMEFERESLMNVEELWWAKEIAVACGGWIEFMVRAIEESPDLVLKKEENSIRRRDTWTVEIAGVPGRRRNLWLETEVEREGFDGSEDYVPDDWTPGEGPLTLDDSTDVDESTGAEGDVSVNNSGDEGDNSGVWEDVETGTSEWGKAGGGWGNDADGDWGASSGWRHQTSVESSEDEKSDQKPPPVTTGSRKVRHVASSSTAGWDGDEDESSDTTS